MARLSSNVSPLDRAIEHYKIQPQFLHELVDGYGVSASKLSHELREQRLRLKRNKYPSASKTLEALDAYNRNPDPESIPAISTQYGVKPKDLHQAIDMDYLRKSFDEEKATVLKNHPKANGKMQAVEHYKLNPNHALTKITRAYKTTDKIVRKELIKQGLIQRPKVSPRYATFQEVKKEILEKYPEADGMTKAIEHYKINKGYPLSRIAKAYEVSPVSFSRELVKNGLREIQPRKTYKKRPFSIKKRPSSTHSKRVSGSTSNQTSGKTNDLPAQEDGRIASSSKRQRTDDQGPNDLEAAQVLFEMARD